MIRCCVYTANSFAASLGREPFVLRGVLGFQALPRKGDQVTGIPIPNSAEAEKGRVHDVSHDITRNAIHIYVTT